MTGEGLRLLRVYKDLKVKDLAEKLGISANYLSEIEKGKKVPSLEIIEKYANVFKTSSSVILFFADMEPPQALAKAKIKSFIRDQVVKFLKSIERDAGTILQN